MEPRSIHILQDYRISRFRATIAPLLAILANISDESYTVAYGYLPEEKKVKLYIINQRKPYNGTCDNGF